MIAARDLAPAQLDSALGRTSPVLKLGIALAWLIGLATTTAWPPPIVLAVAAVTAALTVGRVPAVDLARAVAPLWLAAVGLAFFNTVFGVANADPAASAVADPGPLARHGRRRSRRGSVSASGSSPSARSGRSSP